MTSSKVLLRVENLSKSFPAELQKRWKQDRKMVNVLDQINFEIREGETLAVVGESGCGKTTLGKAILQTCRPIDGQVYFDDIELTALSERELRPHRQKMQMIFQDPYGSLNPRMNVGEIISEGLHIQGNLSESVIHERLNTLLELVHLHPSMKARYPHEFSSGQRQRIGIARAISLHPKLVICDEPISALDISIQAQIINLLIELQQEMDLTYLYISHDLAMVQYISNRVAVMYMGKFMEIGSTEQIFSNPVHPYTQALLSAVAPIEQNYAQKTGMIAIIGDKPALDEPISGCRFMHQCPIAMDICKNIVPELEKLDGDHYVACHRI
jgi:oligopeptide/dipeptide ABC transporter ATP-binding protein